MSNVVEVVSVESLAPTKKSRWRFFAANHWAKATFPATDEPVSDSEVQHCLEPYRRELVGAAVDSLLPQVDVAPRRRSLWMLAAAFWRGSQGWLASTAVHAGAVLVTAMLTLPPPTQHQDVFLDGNIPAPVESELRQVKFAATSLLPGAKAVAGPHVIATPQAAKFELPEIFETSPTGRQSSGLFGDVLAVLSEDRGIASETNHEESSAGADFFGVHAAGNRFVFVIDCSMSMSGPKWQIANQELSDAIARLSEDQFFYVIYFDGDSHPMFGQSMRISALEQATPENIDRFMQWQSAVRVGYNTNPCQSVKHAVHLKPDAVFLLSDGDFNDFTAGFLRKQNRHRAGGPAQVAVHTICFRSPEGQKVLQRIAKENGGTYRFVP